MRSIAFSRWLVVLGLAGHAVACNPGSPPPPPPLPGPMCTDSDTDQGGPPCGLNGNGTDDRLCVLGAWVDQGTCSNDPDACTDGATDTAGPPCGLNGTDDRLCVAGQWVVQGTCSNDAGPCGGGGPGLLPFAAGTGTASDPFVICALPQLLNVSDDMGAAYVLGADVDCAGTVIEPLGFDPSSANLFSGTFDGAGFTLSNCLVEGKAAWLLGTAMPPAYTPGVLDPWEGGGLFRGLSAGATVRDLTLSAMTVRGFVGNVGCLAGFVVDALDEGTITTDPILVDGITIDGCVIEDAKDFIGFVAGHVETHAAMPLTITGSTVRNAAFQRTAPATPGVSYSVFGETGTDPLDGGSMFVGGFLGTVLLRGGTTFVFTDDTLENSTLSVYDPALTYNPSAVGGLIGQFDDRVGGPAGAGATFTDLRVDTVSIDAGIAPYAVGGLVGTMSTAGAAHLLRDIRVLDVTLTVRDWFRTPSSAPLGAEVVGGVVGEFTLNDAVAVDVGRIVVDGLTVVQLGSGAVFNVGGLAGIYQTQRGTPTTAVTVHDVFVRGAMALSAGGSRALGGVFGFLWGMNNRPIQVSRIHADVAITSSASASHVGGLLGEFYDSTFTPGVVFAGITSAYAAGPLSLGAGSTFVGGAIGNARPGAALVDVGFDAAATLVMTDPNPAVTPMTAAQVVAAANAAFTDAAFWALPFTSGIAPL